jgi:hypothetical protein
MYRSALITDGCVDAKKIRRGYQLPCARGAAAQRLKGRLHCANESFSLYLSLLSNDPFAPSGRLHLRKGRF